MNTFQIRVILKLPEIKEVILCIKSMMKQLKKLLSILEKNQFSVSVIYKHLNCYRTFKQYLAEKQLSYSHDEATKWLQINSTVWNHPRYKSARLSLYQLDDLIKNGSIFNNYVYENSSNYDRLSSWCRILLDNYLKDISLTYGDSYINQLRVTGSEFLIYISQIGGKDISAINHKNIIGYFKQSIHKTMRAKDTYTRSIRHFLEYLSNKGLISASLAYTLDRFAIPKIVFIDNLSDFQKEIFIKHATKSIEMVSAKEYYAKAMNLSHVCLDRHDYSKTMKKVFHQAWRDFYIFLEANNLSYSYELAENWCSF